MTLLEYLAAAIPLLGTLIFVHELGHFIVAKLCGVRVLKFSLGFGPPIGFGRFRMRWVRHGTEYVVAWFPLGGFVKMLGEPMPGAEVDEPQVLDAAPDEYLSAKPTWQKLAITFAGPAMNLLLPVVAFVFVLWVGVLRQTAVVGMVEMESPAARVGIQPGDRVVSIGGEAVRWWDDVSEAIAARSAGAVEIEIERPAGGERLALEVPVEQRGALDPFGSAIRTGWIGLGSRRLPALLGVPSGDAPAARAGLHSGDRVTQVGDTPVEDWEGLRRAYAQAGTHAAPGTILFELSRRAGPDAEPETLTVAVPALESLDALGVISATVLVHEVSPGLPADRAGLQTGDLLLAVDGQPVGSFESFANLVRSSGGRPLAVTYARDGDSATLTLEPELRSVPGLLDIEGMDEELYQIGISHALAALPGATALDRQRNPLRSIPRAVDMTVEMTRLFLRGLGKLISGEVGTDKLAGPIGIAEIARKSLDLGWQAYLSTMILISINLGILNLLPIPILDGGQALIYIVEGVKRSPISLRSRELVQQTGLILLVFLMALAFWNDLSRHWNQFVEWLSTAL
jgi:regulator of sigma E protease